MDVHHPKNGICNLGIDSFQHYGTPAPRKKVQQLKTNLRFQSCCTFFWVVCPYHVECDHNIIFVIPSSFCSNKALKDATADMKEP